MATASAHDRQLLLGRRAAERGLERDALRPAVMTLAKPNPLGRMASQVWNQPLDSVRKTNDTSAMTGKPEVVTISQ